MSMRSSYVHDIFYMWKISFDIIELENLCQHIHSKHMKAISTEKLIFDHKAFYYYILSRSISLTLTLSVMDMDFFIEKKQNNNEKWWIFEDWGITHTLFYNVYWIWCLLVFCNTVGGSFSLWMIFNSKPKKKIVFFSMIHSLKNATQTTTAFIIIDARLPTKKYQAHSSLKTLIQPHWNIKQTHFGCLEYYSNVIWHWMKKNINTKWRETQWFCCLFSVGLLILYFPSRAS